MPISINPSVNAQENYAIFASTTRVTYSYQSPIHTASFQLDSAGNFQTLVFEIFIRLDGQRIANGRSA